MKRGVVMDWMNSLKKIESEKRLRLLKGCYRLYMGNSMEQSKERYSVDGVNISKEVIQGLKDLYVKYYASREERINHNEISRQRLLETNKELYYQLRYAFRVFINHSAYRRKFELISKESGIKADELEKYPFEYYMNYASKDEMEQYELKTQYEEKKKTYYINFLLCTQNEFDLKKIEEAVKGQNLSVATVRNHAKYYYNHYATFEERELYEYALSKHLEEPRDDRNYYRSSLYQKVFDTLLEMDSMEEIFKFLDTYTNKNILYFKQTIKTYVYGRNKVWNTGKQEEAEKRLQYILSQYQKRASQRKSKLEDGRRKKKKVESVISEEEADLIVIDTINGQFSGKQKYCTKNNIEIEYYDRCVEIVRKNNPVLFKKYVTMIQRENERKSNEYVAKINEMMFYMENGIPVDDGDNRSFDLLDYFLFTTMDYNKMIRLLDIVMKDKDSRPMRTFITKNKVIREAIPVTVHSILNEHLEIGVKKDERGNLLVGSGSIITEEEKKYIIHYLNRNQIPFHYQLYQLALTRYLKGQLLDREEYLKSIRDRTDRVKTK